MELSTRPRERKRKRLSEAFDSDEDSAFARAGDSLPAYVDIAPTDAAQLAAIAADPELIASIRQIPFALDSQILRYGAYKTRAGKFKCLTCSAHISANNLRKHMVVHFRADYSEQFDEMMDAISTADSAASKRFPMPSLHVRGRRARPHVVHGAYCSPCGARCQARRRATRAPPSQPGHPQAR
eukprot:c17274_g1_i1.p1 GENE.c17274_g1_i1~~c17274_g1_i1.p1  ORF type:complete len:183 (+),score=20.15 c17274_g1_i1:225-773(+)